MRKEQRTRFGWWIVLACALAGCQSTQLDPTGRRVFVPRYATQTEPGPLLCKYDSAISISPRTIIAPVGSEVILVGGVCGFDGYLMSGERVEWMLAQGGVGEFVSLGEREAFVDTVEKVDPHYAIGVTSRRYLTLTRGTPDPGDDVPLLRGQAWISVTSPREGTSHVTAYAPEVYGWDRRKDTARIEWVDARWRLPPSAVNPAGTTHVFTTSVARRSDNAPITGWTVRYQITGGPAGGFKPTGASSIEVPTDSAGNASAELMQTTPAQGTNIIRVEVIRPASAVLGTSSPLVIGIGETRKTWSAPQIGLKKTGPAQAAVGSTMTYRINVTNAGGAEARDVIVTDQVPAGATFVSSNPPAQPGAGGQLSWNLGSVPAGQGRTIELNLKADQAGTINNCASVRTADGLTSQDCISTVVSVAAAKLELRVEGPSQVNVGDNAEFRVRITNSGSAVASGLLVKDTFDAGFRFDGTTGAVERSIENLPPGGAKVLGIALRAVEAGRLCHTVEVVGDGGLRAVSQACVTAVGSPAPQPVPDRQPVPERQPDPVPQGPPPKLSIKKTGPALATVGEPVIFTIEVRNEGTTTAKEFRIVDRYDLTVLKPVRVTDLFELGADNSIAWGFRDLEPGKGVAVQIRADCLKAGERVCTPATVEAAGVTIDKTEHCLTIKNSARLSLSVSVLNVPVNAGQPARFLLKVRNEGQSAARQVALQATLPAEMTLQTVDPGNPSRYRVLGRQLAFDPFPELGPGETMDYRFTLRADQAGMPRLSASVSAAGSEPVTQSADVTVQEAN